MRTYVSSLKNLPLNSNIIIGLLQLYYKHMKFIRQL